MKGLLNLVETEPLTSFTSETPVSPDGKVKTPSSERSSRRLASAISLTSIGSVMTLAISTLANIAIARNGGPTGYATFVAANMLIFVSGVLCSFGLPLALAKYVAAEEEEGRHENMRRCCMTAFALVLLVALISGLAISVNVPRLERYLNISIGPGFAIAFPLVLLCTVAADCISGIYYGLLRPRSVILITIAGQLAMIFYILARGTGVIALPIWGAVAASYICSGLTAGYKSWRDRLLSAPSSISEIRPILKEVPPTATFTFFTTFSAWSDRWIVGTQLGAVAMGSYAAAVVVTQAALRVPTQVAYLLVPASTKVAVGGAEQSARFNRAILGVFGIFAALITVVIVLAPANIVRLIFGPEFTLAAPVLLIMAFSLLSSAISIPFISALTGSTRSRLVIFLLGVILLPRVLLLLFLTRGWSLLGAALATVLSDGLLALCCILLARRIGLNFSLRPLARPYLVGALAFTVGFAALLLNAPHLLAVALAVIVFTPVLWQAARSLRALIK
ncbi:MAG: Polysaccharide biosynthesis protein [Acidobacteriota bacterium]|nr:Polysaccharide biosynthesis protein [Acidobacteriota bacterium]